MPTNRIATKADLEELKANLPYHTFEKRKEENPNGVVEKIKIICMGHEADLKAPIREGVIAEFDTAQSMLKSFVRKAFSKKAFVKSRVVACVPINVTAVEKQVIKDALINSGAREVFVVEKPAFRIVSHLSWRMFPEKSQQQPQNSTCFVYMDRHYMLGMFYTS